MPEYDLLLQPGADLSKVVVHVEGAECLSIASDGSLVIETALGPLTQSVPKTWQEDARGRKSEVVCNFTLLGTDRFGFEATGWDGDSSLTIDPGLIWSTFLGGSSLDVANAMSVDASGVVTVAGDTSSTNFPTTIGAYDTTYNGGTGRWGDAIVSCLDPSKTGAAQLVYSTFLGGSGLDRAWALSVDASGVVTVAGLTVSTDYPTTTGAYDRTYNGGIGNVGDVFVSCLDPSKTGIAQLVFSTYLGGRGFDRAVALYTDVSGVVTLLGYTGSIDFPTTSRAYDTTHNGFVEVFISRLDPSKTGAAQLAYSTYLGGSSYDVANALSVDASGVVTVAGYTSSPNFPTTNGAFDTTHNGKYDVFVTRLDPRNAGTMQLVYSTFLGGMEFDFVLSLSADTNGLITVAGNTLSTNYPTTSGAYDSSYNGGTAWIGGDSFISCLDPRKTGPAQLFYSTYLGGSLDDHIYALHADANGVVTVAGYTSSPNFPTTSGAYDTTFSGGGIYSIDAFVSRLDPRKTGAAQLVYSTFLGGSSYDYAYSLAVDAAGVAMVGGIATSTDFPTTTGAYDTTHNGGGDTFVSRVDMGVALYGDLYEVSITTGGTQKLTVNAGKAHANRLYWIFGSETGTSPGVDLLGVHIPLNPDLYTVVAMGAVNTTVFTKFRGTLDANGLATASFNVPANLPLPPGFMFHHAYVVYDASGRFYMASNAVPLRLK